MSTNIIPTLKAELTELEADLRADPRYRKMVRIRELLADYEADSGPRPPSLFDKLGTPPSHIRERMTARAASKEARIKQELRALFGLHGSVHRTKILEHLIAKELMGHEKNPMAALAAYLSSWKEEFDFDGKGNWSLRASPAPIPTTTGAIPRSP